MTLKVQARTKRQIGHQFLTTLDSPQGLDKEILEKYCKFNFILVLSAFSENQCPKK